jgi:hypothetical protein
LRQAFPDSNIRSRKLPRRNEPRRPVSCSVFHSPLCFKKCKKLKVSFDNFSLGLSMLVLTRNMVCLRKSSRSAEAPGVPLIKESKKKVEARLSARDAASESIASGYVQRQGGCSIVNS